jgi:hypothetical protein
LYPGVFGLGFAGSFGFGFAGFFGFGFPGFLGFGFTGAFGGLPSMGFSLQKIFLLKNVWPFMSVS